MSQFEFFMTFYGLLLGLGMAELLLAFANVVRARQRPRIGGLTPALGVFMFVQMLASFNDAWFRLQGVAINFDGMALPTLIGVAYFFAAVIVVPRDLEEWGDLDEYFMSRRGWTVGLLLAVFLLSIAIEVTGDAALWRSAPLSAGRLTYLAINLIGLALFLTALLARRRPALIALIVQSVMLVLLYSQVSGSLLRPADRPAQRPPSAPAPKAAEP